MIRKCLCVVAASVVSSVAAAAADGDFTSAEHVVVEQVMTEVESGAMQPCDAMARMKPLVEKVPNIYRMSFESHKKDEAWLDKQLTSDFRMKVLFVNDRLYSSMADYFRGVTKGGTADDIDKALSVGSCIVNCTRVTRVTKPDDLPMCQREPWSNLIPAAQAKAVKLREDAKCDADPACVKQRAKDRLQAMELNICTDVARRDHVKGKIAKEQKYSKEAGVVDLRALQSMKEQLQELDGSIESGKANYARETKTAFQQKTCRNYDIAITDE